MIFITGEYKIAGAVSVLSLLAAVFISLVYIVPPPEPPVRAMTGDIATERENALFYEVYPPELSRGESAYILRDCGGYVGIYSGADGGEPDILTEISVANLRAADAESLRRGITVYGDEALAKIVEDLNS